MNKSVRALLILAIALFPLTILAKAQTQPIGGTLAWRAQIAKDRGLKSITMGGSHENDLQMNLREQLHNSLVIDGEVESSTVDASDGASIYSWYRVKVIARGPTPTWVVQGHEGRIPASLKSVGEGEILVRLDCGSVVVDGITITEVREPSLTLGKRYLLFLEPYEISTRPTELFVSTLQTEPTELDRDGSIVHARKSSFTDKLANFTSIKDVLDYGKQ